MERSLSAESGGGLRGRGHEPCWTGCSMIFEATSVGQLGMKARILRAFAARRSRRRAQLAS